MIELFHSLFTTPIVNVIVLFYKLLLAINVPYALGFAVIVMTIVMKLLLYPLMSAQIKSAKKMQDLAPDLAKIKDKYKKDKTRQQQEMMKLYKEKNINPASGCLPVLLQFPILIGLYQALTKLITIESPDAIEKINSTLYSSFLHLDKAWTADFFGISLSHSPSSMFASAPWIVIVPLITALTQFILSKMMMSANPQPKKDKDDFQSAIQTQSLFIFPIMIGWFSFTLPFGLSLYWNTFTIFGILQQYHLVGLGGLTPWVHKIRNHGK
jgi:YidC/Oxa1 family membrane protein insertase